MIRRVLILASLMFAAVNIADADGLSLSGMLKVGEEGVGGVVLTAEETSLGVVGIGVSSATGFYKIDDLSNDLYLIHCYPGDEYVAPVDIVADMRGGISLENQDFALTLGREVKGTVFFDSEGVADCSVSAENENENVIYAAVTDEQGDYILFRLKNESYTIHCYPTEEYIAPETLVVSLESIEEATGVDFVLSEGGSVSGQVYASDATTPLEDVLVLALPEEMGEYPVGSILTDENGDYLISGLAPGVSYTLEACAADVTFQEITGVSVSAGAESGNNDFIASDLSISGIVLALDGVMGVADVDIKAATGTDVIARSISSATGYYALHGLESGFYNVYAVSDHYRGSVERDIQIDDTNVTGVDIAALEGSLIGTITYDQSPVAGALITIKPIFEDLNSDWVLYSESSPSATTDSQGEYTIDFIPEGSYTVVASKTGFVDIVTGPIEISDQTLGLPFSFESATPATITGTVVDNDEEPLEGVNLSLWLLSNEHLWATTSNMNGEFSFTGLPSGTFELQIPFPEGYVPENKQIQLQAGTTADGVDFELCSSTGGISGMVLDGEEEPVAPVFVTAKSPSTGYCGAAVNDENGEYLLAPLGPATDYLVTLYVNGQEYSTLSSVTVTDNEITSGVDFNVVD